jgi:hypothetical protein
MVMMMMMITMLVLKIMPGRRIILCNCLCGVVGHLVNSDWLL